MTVGRWALIVSIALVIAGLGAASGHAAQPRDLRAERQGTIEFVLARAQPASLAQDRLSCLSGQEPKGIAHGRSLGALGMPDAADYCITVLTRLARDGERSLLRDAKIAEPTAASALDNGFMIAYGKGEAIPASLPTMATLKPIAESCLAMAQSNVKLCYATGYAFGQRAFHGEVVTVR